MMSNMQVPTWWEEIKGVNSLAGILRGVLGGRWGTFQLLNLHCPCVSFYWSPTPLVIPSLCTKGTNLVVANTLQRHSKWQLHSLTDTKGRKRSWRIKKKKKMHLVPSYQRCFLSFFTAPLFCNAWKLFIKVFPVKGKDFTVSFSLFRRDLEGVSESFFCIPNIQYVC